MSPNRPAATYKGPPPVKNWLEYFVEAKNRAQKNRDRLALGLPLNYRVHVAEYELKPTTTYRLVMIDLFIEWLNEQIRKEQGHANQEGQRNDSDSESDSDPTSSKEWDGSLKNFKAYSSSPRPPTE